MSPPIKELMKHTLEKRIAHGGHPFLRRIMDNVFVRQETLRWIKKYISHHGFSVFAKFYSGTSKGKKIVSVINGGKPCHLILHDHYKYGDHSVLAVGYQQIFMNIGMGIHIKRI